ncbi:MAG: hypothetical protein JST18_02950 [Bacteroidetes bacterium]|nr:hypothetical protein [Bacteroidota bacterium]
MTDKIINHGLSFGLLVGRPTTAQILSLPRSIKCFQQSTMICLQSVSDSKCCQFRIVEVKKYSLPDSIDMTDKIINHGLSFGLLVGRPTTAQIKSVERSSTPLTGLGKQPKILFDAASTFNKVAED